MKFAWIRSSQLGNDWTPEHHIAKAEAEAPALRTDHACTQATGHGTSCGNLAFTTRDGQWLCPHHADRRDWEAAHQDDEGA